MKAKSGFTLVEILIVVVILGILAAIVIPQFTEAGEEARLSSLTSDLQTLRGQLELYEIQHNDSYPALATFEAQMCQTTDIDGNASGSKARAGLFQLGPYLQAVPINPFTNNNTVVGWGAGAAASPFDGWEYNDTTGEIRAAPDGTADSGAHILL